MPSDFTSLNQDLPPKLIRLDLTTEVLSPLSLNQVEIGVAELEELSRKIDAYRQKNKLSPAVDSRLELVAITLRDANLGLFSRELTPSGIIPKDPKFIQLTEETFGVGSFNTLATSLETLPDYNLEILSGDQKFLSEVANGIRERNLAYCQERLPHYSSVGGIPLFNKLARLIEDNDIAHAIALRLNEGDKMRNRGELTQFIQRVFGGGFRLSNDFQLHSSNQ